MQARRMQFSSKNHPAYSSKSNAIPSNLEHSSKKNRVIQKVCKKINYSKA